MPNQSKASILIQQQQAASQNTSSEQLRELAATGNKAICERVAANPNTPTDILLKLGAKFPKQLLENPVLPLLLLENPNFVEDIPLNTLISLLKEKQVPAFILDTASKHYNKDILILVASNPNTCKTILENLANSTYEEVQEAAKLHVNLAGEIQLAWEEVAEQAIKSFKHERIDKINIQDLVIAQLIPDFLIPALHDIILCIIAEHPNTPIHTLEKLCENTFYYRVHKAVASNPKTPINLLKLLVLNNLSQQQISKSDNSGEVLAAVATNSNTPTYILEKLYQHPYKRVRAAVANHPNTPVTLLEILADDVESDVRSSVAINPNIQINSLKILCVDQDFSVRRSVAENNNITANLLLILARDKERVIRSCVASHINAPERALELLAKDEDEWVRSNVAINPITKESLLQVLAKDKSTSVSQSVVSNPNTPISLLQMFAQDENHFVRKNVASNPNTPLWLLEELAKDKHPEVHLGLMQNSNVPQNLINLELAQQFPHQLAKNPKTPTNILIALAKHEDSRVRFFVAQNHSAPEEALEILAKDRVYDVRHTAARNPNMCKDKFAKITLERIAKSSAPSFSRFIVFLHPQVPQQALVKNYRSPLWLERYAIAQNPNTPQHIITELTLDANQLVRAAAKAAVYARFES